MKSVILSTLKNLESQVAALRAALNEIPEVSSVQPKEKRVMSAGVAAWNENVKSVLSQMVAADWKHPVTGKSAIYRDALAEAGRLRGLADPEVAKKQAEQKVKKAEKKAAKAASSSASSVASAASVASAPSVAEQPSEKKERKNPWLGLTEEQKAERVAKMAAGKLAKKEAAAAAPSVAVAPSVAPSVPSASNPFDDAPVSDAESATSSKKRGPPKGVKLSEEERLRRAAKAKATRDAKKVAGAAAVPLPESPPPSSASSVIVDEIDEETFTKQQIGSKIVYKNAKGHVRAYTTEGAGIWLGMYDPVKKVIDASVPEPAE